MLKKIRLSVLAIFCSGMAFAQSTGSIIFNVVDENTKASLPFASVVVTRGGEQVGGGQTDLDGNVEIKPLEPGQYDVKAVYAGYHDFNESGIDVVPNTPVHLTIKMSSLSIKMQEVVIKYSKPAVDPSGHVNNNLDQKEIQENALKGDPLNMVAMMAGATQSDIGQPLHLAGSRSEENQIIIDGQKITADQNSGGIPQSMIGEINSYISGDVPAKYGDAIGGVIEINTINASPKFFGSAEAITSEALDAFGYNDFNFVVGGPIWSKKDTNGKKSVNSFPSVNFILGGEYSYQQTADPNFVGGYYINQSTLQGLQANPLVANPLGGFNRSSEYITDADIYHTKGLQNDASQNASANLKIDLRVNNLVTVTVGGSYQYTYKHVFESVYEIFNNIEDPLQTTNAYRGWVRLRQRFLTAPPSKDGKPALIQNAYYTLQAEYGNTYNVTENTYFKNNLFDYGYIGKFDQYLTPHYSFNNNGPKGPGYYQDGFNDSALTFKPGTQNPYLANYTTDVYNSLGAQSINNQNILEQNLGLMNGDAASNVYSLWYNTGRSYPSYAISNSSHFRFTANFSATIKSNDIQIGFEYEQNILSSFSMNGTVPALWSLMRQNTNTQISQLDLANPYLVQANQSNTWGYNRLYNPNVQSQFDKSLRQKLGLPVNGTQWLDPDSYDPSMYSLSMFSASDLLNNGSSLVSYYGYNYDGTTQSGTPTIDNYFNQRDANGNLTYPVAPYHPIYIAGYIQDHFEFKSLRFDVGVRVDRFDANQPVLKDPYLLYPAKTVSEVRSTNPNLAGEIPGSVKGSDVVYVNNSQSPTEVVGYRNGSTWYDANGNIITDPTVLASATSTGGIQPYLENPNQTSIGSNAFTSYTPQVSVMPRIAFSFPISDMAGFFAHYDILTSRPPGVGYNIFNPEEYEFIQSNIGGILTNPALKPVQTTDYELGFTQALNERKTTALTLSAFYKAPRSQIETYRFLDAYPVSYMAYNNIDFGTIKGLTLAYTLSRVGDFKMRASYTLSFATGTGSGPSSGYNLANSGNPNLQIPIPLDYDQRHTLQLNLDYHFQAGQDAYDGPIVKTHSGNSIEILANAGINLNLVASSGTPYTVQGNATEGDPNAQNVGIGIAQHYSLVGSVNGSNLPWQYRVDMKIDKDFPITIKGKDKDQEGHKCDLQAYIAFTNLLNTENVLNVYHYTGSATDDGYLASAAGMQAIPGQTSPKAFVDQYKIKEQDPTYLAMPRTIRLGLTFNF